MIEDLEDVVLTCNLLEHKLMRGDIGIVVLVHQQGKGYEVEFTTLDGESIALVTLTANQFAPVNRGKLRTCVI